MEGATVLQLVKSRYSYKEYYPFDIEKKLRQHILEGDLEKSLEISEFFFILLERNVDTIRDMRCLVLELLLVCVRKSFQMGFDVDDFMASTLDYAEKLNNCDSYNEIKNFQQFCIKSLAIRIRSQQGKQKIEIVFKAQRYIENHYHKNLKLQDVAETVGFSSSYFSRLFSQETGLTFQDYLAHVRVKEAQKLLLNHDWSLQEISNQVGYQEASYFIKVFKRVVGTTPRQFVMQHCKGNRIS